MHWTFWRLNIEHWAFWGMKMVLTITFIHWTFWTEASFFWKYVCYGFCCDEWCVNSCFLTAKPTIMECPTFTYPCKSICQIKTQCTKDVTMVDCPRYPCKFNELTQQGQHACSYKKTASNKLTMSGMTSVQSATTLLFYVALLRLGIQVLNCFQYTSPTLSPVYVMYK